MAGALLYLLASATYSGLILHQMPPYPTDLQLFMVGMAIIIGTRIDIENNQVFGIMLMAVPTMLLIGYGTFYGFVMHQMPPHTPLQFITVGVLILTGGWFYIKDALMSYIGALSKRYLIAA